MLTALTTWLAQESKCSQYIMAGCNVFLDYVLHVECRGFKFHIFVLSSYEVVLVSNCRTTSVSANKSVVSADPLVVYRHWHSVSQHIDSMSADALVVCLPTHW